MLQVKDPDNKLVSTLRSDVTYLQSQGLLDYSLLVAYEISPKKMSYQQILQERLKSDSLIREGKQSLIKRKREIASTVKQNNVQSIFRASRN